MSKLYIGIRSKDGNKKVTSWIGENTLQKSTTFKAVDDEDAKRVAEYLGVDSFGEISRVWLKGIDYGK